MYERLRRSEKRRHKEGGGREGKEDHGEGNNSEAEWRRRRSGGYVEGSNKNETEGGNRRGCNKCYIEKEE